MSGETSKDISAWTVDSLHTYMDQRFELLYAERDKLFNLLNATTPRENLTNIERIDALKGLIQVQMAAIDKATTLALAAQQNVNMSQNEWRAALNDITRNLPGRPEFDRLSNDFAAYRLETARILAAGAGAIGGVKETKEETRASLSSVVAIAAVVVSVIIGAIQLLPTHQPSPLLTVPPGYKLVPQDSK
jgi:hypothetical protein